jgi:hypothetical protein
MSETPAENKEINPLEEDDLKLLLPHLSNVMNDLEVAYDDELSCFTLKKECGNRRKNRSKDKKYTIDLARRDQIEKSLRFLTIV